MIARTRKTYYIHFLDLQAWNLHTANNIGEQSYHVVVAHGHVGHDLLEGNLLGRVILVLLTTTVELQSQLRNFSLNQNLVSEVRRRSMTRRRIGMIGRTGHVSRLVPYFDGVEHGYGGEKICVVC